jgi:D-beta-D-heptose 7-phosphate kinase/D-beta-D-heptose 1-phosphate adenosyltransferase
MSTLLDTLDRWKPFTAIVVGDFMLDQLVFGNADRLSPEAPVPVLQVQRNEDRPGGAANVCLDLVAMRGVVHAVGVTGDDREADLLRSALAAAGVNSDALVPDTSRPTTVKRSLIGLAQHRHPQKMFRLDSESRLPLSREIEDRLFQQFLALLSTANVVCIEDYNKGVCTARLCQSIIKACRENGVPVLVDPAAIDDYSRYAGATTITPNRNEATGATGDRIAPEADPSEYAPIAQRLLDELKLDVGIITLDKHGCLLLERGKEPIVAPTYARQVYDVTGAGDMVLAALSAGIANGMTWHDAVRFANAAAGLEVEVFGVVPMPIETIHRECLLRERGLTGKLRTLDQLMVELGAVRSAGKTVVFTNGVFDVIHAGHVHVLQEAKRQGDYLVVAINSDACVKRYKGPTRPVNCQDDRAAVLGAMECVDSVTIFDENTPAETIEKLRPNVLVKGGEFNESEMPGAAFVKSLGGKVVRVAMKPGLSSTETLRKLGDVRAETTPRSEVYAEFVKDRGASAV